MATEDRAMPTARAAAADAAEPVVSGEAGIPIARPKLDWLLGCTNESYGTMVWRSRVENLKCHFDIISHYLPDDVHWLRNQVRSAIEQAQQYIDDYAPELPAQGIAAGTGETGTGSTEGKSPVRKDAPNPQDQD